MPAQMLQHMAYLQAQTQPDNAFVVMAIAWLVVACVIACVLMMRKKKED